MSKTTNKTNKTTIVNGKIICKCGKDLGSLKNNEAYYCNECEILYFSSENAIALYNKKTILDYTKDKNGDPDKNDP